MMERMSKDDKPMTDQLKQVVDDLQLEERVREAATATEQAVLRGLDATGSYLRDHRADIEGFIERATTAIDRQTSGRFADQVDQMRSQLTAGVAGIAERRLTNPPDPEPGELPSPTEAGLGTDEGPDPMDPGLLPRVRACRTRGPLWMPD